MFSAKTKVLYWFGQKNLAIKRINEARPGFYKCRDCVLVDTVNTNIDCPLIRKNVLKGLI